MIELQVKISKEDSHLVKKELIYDSAITLSIDDPYIAKLVKQAKDEFKHQESDNLDIVVRAKLMV